MKCHCVCGEKQHPVHRRAILCALQFAVLDNHRPATEPCAIGRTRSPLPCAIEQIVIALIDCLAHRREHAAMDIQRIAVNLFRGIRIEIGPGERRGRADHHAPAHTGIDRRKLRNNPHHRGGRQFMATQLRRFDQIEQPRLGQRACNIGRQAAPFFQITGPAAQTIGQCVNCIAERCFVHAPHCTIGTLLCRAGSFRDGPRWNYHRKEVANQNPLPCR